MTWKQARSISEISRLAARKAFKIKSSNHPRINENLSCQNTESTIVLAMLRSTGKSQRPCLTRRQPNGLAGASRSVWYSTTKEEQILPPKWSSGHATASLRFAALASSNGVDGKEKGCTEGAKQPPRIICVFSKRDFPNRLSTDNPLGASGNVLGGRILLLMAFIGQLMALLANDWPIDGLMA